MCYTFRGCIFASELDNKTISQLIIKPFIHKLNLTPDDCLFVDSIPQLGTGKMDKNAVKANLKAEGYVLPDLR